MECMNPRKLRRIFYLLGLFVVIPILVNLTIPNDFFTIPRSLNLYQFEYNKLNKTKQRTTSSSPWYILKSAPASLTDVEIIQNVSKEYPNIPIDFWYKTRQIQETMFYKNSSCAKFPNIFNIDLHNLYWQLVYIPNVIIQVYSAYYDVRPIVQKMVRILAMTNRTYSNFPVNRTLHCQLWYEGETEPVIVPVNSVEYLWFPEWTSHADGKLGPYCFGCSVPEKYFEKIPALVSLVDKPCDAAKNMLRVVYEKPDSKKEFTVCVKGLDFPQTDLSYRLVEWIELIFLMGVDKIFMYQLDVHPNVKKVLDFYIKLGKVDLRLITLPFGQPTIPFIQHTYISKHVIQQSLDEIIPYNDCFYRNIYSYQYVSLLDIDEIIIPLMDKDWHGLLERAVSHDIPNLMYNGFTARHIYFLDDMTATTESEIPNHMHMLKHVFRSKNFSLPGEYVKTIFNTNYTIACHNHWPKLAANKSITRLLRLSEAQMRHYRKKCHYEVNCTKYNVNPVKDVKLWEYKDMLIPRVSRVLKALGFAED